MQGTLQENLTKKRRKTQAGLEDSLEERKRIGKIGEKLALQYEEKELVKKGWAIAYRYYSNDYIVEEEIAKKNQSGIWKGNFEEPYLFRRKNN